MRDGLTFSNPAFGGAEPPGGVVQVIIEELHAIRE
jgi:hypothetical protein